MFRQFPEDPNELLSLAGGQAQNRLRYFAVQDVTVGNGDLPRLVSQGAMPPLEFFGRELPPRVHSLHSLVCLPAKLRLIFLFQIRKECRQPQAIFRS